MELCNRSFQVAGELDLVELSSTEYFEAVDYLSYVAEVQVALTECYQSHKDCSLPAVLGIVVLLD